VLPRKGVPPNSLPLAIFVIFSSVLFAGSTSEAGTVRCFTDSLTTALSPVQSHTPGYLRAVQAFEEQNLALSRRGVLVEHLPYALLHHKKTENVVLLIHGLAESPKGVREVAQAYFDQGYNVLTVLLDGHGSDPHALLDISVDSWRSNVDAALQIAEELGEKLIVGGFSTGGAMTVDAAFRHPDKIAAIDLYSPLFNISPTLEKFVSRRLQKLNNWNSQYSEDIADGTVDPLSNPYLWTSPSAIQTEPSNGYRYARTPTQIQGALNLLLSDIHTRGIHEKLSIPIHIVYTDADGMADPDSIHKFVQAQEIPHRRVTVFSAEKKVSHEDCIRPRADQLDVRAAIEIVVKSHQSK